MNNEYKIDLPLTEQMSADVAYKNVTVAVRAVTANAETHENLAKSLGVIREQLVAFATLQIVHGELQTTFYKLQAAYAKEDAGTRAVVDAHTVQ